MLYVLAKITNADSTADLTDMHTGAPINLMLYIMFSQVDVSFNRNTNFQFHKHVSMQSDDRNTGELQSRYQEITTDLRTILQR